MAPMSAPTKSDLASTLDRLRADAPLVQCIINTVVTNFAANVLLASGASPAMVDNPHEAGEFARVAGGVLVNLGTPRDDTAEAMRVAVRAAADQGTPWVLDPVAVGGLTWRTALAKELIEIAPPAVIRGNASEIAAVAGNSGSGRGTDSVQTPDDVVGIARALARDLGCVVAASGAVDLLTDGSRVVRLANGSPLLTKVTGGGCALGALVAACVAVAPDPLVGASTATALLTVAADIAAAQASGPGSFAVHLLDTLSRLSPDQLAAQVKLSQVRPSQG